MSHVYNILALLWLLVATGAKTPKPVVPVAWVLAVIYFIFSMIVAIHQLFGK
jgi:hypothetical protein